MPTGAIAAWNTILKMDDGALNYTAIAEVTTINGYKLKADMKDVTSHGSASAYHEMIPTLKSAGTVTFTINYVPTAATHKNAAGGLIYAFDQKLKRSFQLNFPDATTVWACQGFVSDFAPKEPVGDQLSADVTITLTGVPTLA